MMAAVSLLRTVHSVALVYEGELQRRHQLPDECAEHEIRQNLTRRLSARIPDSDRYAPHKFIDKRR